MKDLHYHIAIFVAAHKPDFVIHDEVHTPIHVGRVVSKFKAEMAEMLGDDTGENISEKNPSYCEMTAHYWIWKNVKDAEFVGLCHYRRYFGCEITQENISQLMQDYDVMLVEPSYYVDSVFSYFAKFVGAENMTILAEVMKRLYPDYYDTLVKLCDGVKFYPFNMLVCRKPLYDQYCEWMFTVLQTCEQYIKPSPYTNGRRALAYLAEMLTSVYFLHRQLRIKAVPYLKVEGGQKILVKRSEEENRVLAKYEALLQNELAWKVKEDRKEKFDNPAIIIGLKNDGLPLFQVDL